MNLSVRISRAPSFSDAVTLFGAMQSQAVAELGADAFDKHGRLSQRVWDRVQELAGDYWAARIQLEEEARWRLDAGRLARWLLSQAPRSALGRPLYGCAKTRK
ncbi:hypothetical protein [Nocardia wallacei]|uniref:hypothetical protein n=1 Tax=Nocardia wallacei TaxID=480035 RepID=UPI0024555C16|nr:hypothetical protein [Nocardia wallacei]